MKKALITLILAAVLSVSALFSDEVSAIWSRLYSRARGYEDRIMIMKGLVEIDEESIIPFLGSALQELNEARANEMSVTQNMRHIELTKLIVRRLGEFKSADFSDLMFDVYKNTVDVYLRAETVLALGRTVDPSYSDDIAIFLRNLNLNIGAEITDKDSEVLALAAVLALERFRQPVGFNALFFASIGWYSKQSTVREQAARALDTLVEDPTPILKNLVRLETDHAVKLEALEAEGRSKAPAEGKAAVAAEAIRQGLVNEPVNQAAKSVLGRLRQRGLELLIANGPAETGVVKYLEEIIFRQFDINEQLTAVMALDADGRTDAVAALVRFLKIQNDRQQSGLTPADYRVIRSVIKTLGNIGNQAAFEELIAVKISNWPSSVTRDADEAIGKLKGTSKN